MTGQSDHFLSSLLTANDTTQAMQAAVSYISAALRCDISWTGLVQADDQLHMGAHHGLQTSEMAAAWSLAVGEGIGGRAASLGSTQKSSNYLHDSRRVPAKRLIDNERIATVLVAPLIIAGVTSGVLYAAHRNLRPWTQHDVHLLESAGHHLSIRLHQLGLNSLTHSTIRDYERKATAATSALRSSSELIESLTNSGDIGSTLMVAASSLNARIELHDADGLVLFASGPDERACRGARSSYELGPQSRLSIRIVGADERPSPADPPVRFAVNALRLQVLRLSERETTREELRGDLLESLLSGRFSDAGPLQRRLSLMGLSRLAKDTQVIVLEPRNTSNHLSDRFHDDLRTTFPQSLIDHHESSTIIVTGDTPSEEYLVERMTYLLNREERKQSRIGEPTHQRLFTAGLGRRSNQLQEVSVSYAEAAVACSIGHTDKRADDVGLFSARALGLRGLASMPRSQLRETVRDTFGPLFDYDKSRGTNFMRTVRSYLSNDRHLGNTASELHLHYNTVRNRISRIEEMLDLNFDYADDRYRAETAIRMDSVLTAFAEPLKPDIKD